MYATVSDLFQLCVIGVERYNRPVDCRAYQTESGILIIERDEGAGQHCHFILSPIRSIEKTDLKVPFLFRRYCYYTLILGQENPSSGLSLAC